MKPWKQIARPHQDVLEGKLKQSDFAADLSQAATGKASPEYQDAEQFFARTYITEGMRQLLISVAQRLAGKDGDPVIELKTNFGGGKTHSLLAVYHLATFSGISSRLDGVAPLLDEAGINDLPKANTAVIDGIALSPSQPLQRGALTIKTLWGFLAYQLLGETGYQMVAPSDESGTAPGKEVLVSLLTQAAPCVILCDELVAFLRQLDNKKTLSAGTLKSNMTFIQALTESVKLVPNAILLASLPESDSELIGSSDLTFHSLQKYFGRLESIWRPVATDEAFEIVRRRLFDKISDTSAQDAVCTEIFDFYRENKASFPAITQESSYLDRLKKSYPIHPEFFDRLYADWSALDNFQKTRGVLQYLAQIIHRLWQADNHDPLIMPGSIPLDDPNVQNQNLRYLPPNWNSVIECEVDGPSSVPAQLDTQNTRIGQVYAAHRVTRTLFLGTAPHSSQKKEVRGMTMSEILLGAVVPGTTIGWYEEAFTTLRNQLHYLFSTTERCWFDTHPNLRREMESRKGKFDEFTVTKQLETITQQCCGKDKRFAGFHIGAIHSDIPDHIDAGLRLVILPLKSEHSFSPSLDSGAVTSALSILNNRGDQPRLYKGRIVFLVTESNNINRVLNQCRTYLAWKEINEAISSQELNMDTFQANQAKKEETSALKYLEQAVLDAYNYLLVPDMPNAKDIKFQSIRIQKAEKLLPPAAQRLVDEESLIETWSAVHLKDLLAKYYFKDGITDKSAKWVWEDMGKYCQMPRLYDVDVFIKAVQEGIAEGLFGYALEKEGDQYSGFHFAENFTAVHIDDKAVLIQKDAALAYQKALTPPPAPAAAAAGDFSRTNAADNGGNPDYSAQSPSVDEQTAENSPRAAASPNPPAGSKTKVRYIGITKELTAKERLTSAASNIENEILLNLKGLSGVEIQVRIDITATSSAPFEDRVVRTIRENCQNLGLPCDMEED